MVAQPRFPNQGSLQRTPLSTLQVILQPTPTLQATHRTTLRTIPPILPTTHPHPDILVLVVHRVAMARRTRIPALGPIRTQIIDPACLTARIHRIRTRRATANILAHTWVVDTNRCLAAFLVVIPGHPQLRPLTPILPLPTPIKARL